MSGRKPEDTKVATVCCSVRIRYKQAITKYVENKDGSIANVMGKILEKWVEDNKLLELIAPVVNENQEILEFREDN
jgi:hypothetical protein